MTLRLDLENYTTNIFYFPTEEGFIFFSLQLKIVFGLSKVQIFLSHNKNHKVTILQMRYHSTAFICYRTEITIKQNPIILTTSIGFSYVFHCTWQVLQVKQESWVIHSKDIHRYIQKYLYISLLWAVFWPHCPLTTYLDKEMV